MNIGGIIRGASESFSGAARAFGAKRASSKEAKGYKEAFRILEQLRGEAETTRKYIDPFHESRQLAARRLADITLGDPSKYVAQDPGYQFRLQEGTREVERAAAARGLGTSGNVLAALQERAQGLASQEYGASVARLMELGGGYAQQAAIAGQTYGRMQQARIEGQAQAAIGKGFSKSRGTAGYYEFHAQANAAAGRGVASIWEAPGMGGGSAGGGTGGMGGIGSLMGSIGGGFGG